MSKLDERGSKAQHDLYNLLVQAYPKYTIEYEYPIGDLGQRIDLFIPALGIAIEYDGIQHFQYNSFFFKDEGSWNNSVRLDTKKNKYLNEHGVKIVRIPYTLVINEASELKEIIDSVEYPDYPYSGIEKESSFKKIQKERQKAKQKEYKKRNSFNKDNEF